MLKPAAVCGLLYIDPYDTIGRIEALNKKKAETQEPRELKYSRRSRSGLPRATNRDE